MEWFLVKCTMKNFIQLEKNASGLRLQETAAHIQYTDACKSTWTQTSILMFTQKWKLCHRLLTRMFFQKMTLKYFKIF